MKNNKYILTILLLAVISFQSCSEWLNVQPSDRQTEESLYKTKTGLYSALNGIYTKLGSDELYGKNLSYGVVEIAARRYVPNTSNLLYSQIINYQYSLDKASEAINSIWQESFSTILNCNVFMKNLKKSKDLMPQSEIDLLEGEVLALRAFIHFDMLRLYGPIYSIDPKGKAIPYNEYSEIVVTDILEADDALKNYILRDIQKAEQLLAADPVLEFGAAFPNTNSNGVFEDAVAGKNFRQIRFNYYALQLLKARVYLYMGDKENALITAKKIIETPNMTTLFPFVNPAKLLGNNYDPDRAFSTEVFFGFYNKKRNDVYRLNFDNEQTTTDLLQPRAGYVKDIMFGGLQFDYRYQKQWGLTSSSSNQQPTLVRYKKLEIPDGRVLPFFATFVPMIRLSEAYLIAAECETDMTKAYGYFNTLFIARGNAVKDVDSRAELDKDIIREYLRETFGEGQSFYLFKRLNMNIAAEYNGNANASHTMKNNKARLVFPFPEGEVAPR